MERPLFVLRMEVLLFDMQSLPSYEAPFVRFLNGDAAFFDMQSLPLYEAPFVRF